MSKKRIGARQRGAAAIEFALLLPVLLMLIAGIVDLSLAMNASALTGSAARQGARAIALGANTTAATNVAMSQISFLPGASDPGTKVTFTCTGADGAPCSLADSNSDAGGSVRVAVAYVHTWILPGILGIGNTTTIVQTSEMRIEG